MSQTVPYRLGIGGPKLRGEVDLTHTHGYRTLHIFVRDTGGAMEHQGDIYRLPDLSQPLKGQPGLALVETMCGPNGYG